MNIEQVVEKYVQREMSEYDIAGITRSVIRDIVSKEVSTAIKPIVETEIRAIIQTEIESIFTTEVQLNDGYKKETFPTFEEFFKAEFKKKLNDQYQVRAVIEKLVKDRVQSLIQQDYAKVVETIVDTLTASKLVKKP